MPNQKSTVFQDPDQFKMPEDLLDRLPLRTVIEAIKLLHRKYGNDVVIVGKVMGPWTLSYHLHGVQDFLVETITEPEIVHAFLDKFKDISLKFAEAQFEAGAAVLTWADHATADLIGPSAYRDFLLPVHKKINERLKGRTIILHCCGNTFDRIEYFAEAGFPQSSVRERKAFCPGPGLLLLPGRQYCLQLCTRGWATTGGWYF